MYSGDSWPMNGPSTRSPPSHRTTGPIVLPRGAGMRLCRNWECTRTVAPGLTPGRSHTERAAGCCAGIAVGCTDCAAMGERAAAASHKPEATSVGLIGRKFLSPPECSLGDRLFSLQVDPHLVPQFADDFPPDVDDAAARHVVEPEAPEQDEIDPRCGSARAVGDRHQAECGFEVMIGVDLFFGNQGGSGELRLGIDGQVVDAE